MHAWEAIQKTIDYIEEHLTEQLQIEELSKIAGLSQFYFQRLFTRLVKVPVAEYIKLRRLAWAADDLKRENERILDIALKYRFSTHANFTRAFKEAYAITPEECRKHDVALNQFVKPDLRLNYVDVDENVPLITEGMVIEITHKKLEKPKNYIGIARQILISELMGGTDTSVSETEKLWNDFHQAKAEIPGLIAGGNEFGVLYMGNAEPGYCMYMAGAEAEYGAVAQGYDNFELPATEYLVCGYEAENFVELTTAALYKAQIFMGRYMEKHKLTTTDFAGEMYDPVTEGHAYMENWMIPVQMQS